MLASTVASAGAVYKCASGKGGLVYQDTPCQGGSALVAAKKPGAVSGAVSVGQVPPQCLMSVSAKSADSMALQMERVAVHGRMRVYVMREAAPLPDDDPVKRDQCSSIVAKYDSLLKELNNSSLDELKKLASCFIRQSNLLYAEQAKFGCGVAD